MISGSPYHIYGAPAGLHLQGMSSRFVGMGGKLPSFASESLSISATAWANIPQSLVPSSTKSVDPGAFLSSVGSEASLDDDGICFIKLVIRSRTTMSPV